MSSHYSAGQFDHAFKPSKLGNFMGETNPWPGKVTQLCSPIRCEATQFIAYDNGHLCPEMRPEGRSTAWIWEKVETRCCTDKLPKPRKLTKPTADDCMCNNVVDDDRDPCEDIWVKWAGKAICGTKEAVQKQLRKQRYEQRVKMMQERKRNKARGQPKILAPMVFRFSIDGISRCGAPMKKNKPCCGK